MTCSASCSRSRPWSTNTQVSRSPIARWISAAATDESTPPDRPSRTSSRAGLRADRAHGLVDVVVHVPVVAAAADVVREAGEQRRALLRVRDLGMELHGVEAARLVGHRGNGAGRRRADELEAGGHRRDLVAVAHPHVEEAVPFLVRPVLEAAKELRVPARANFGVAEFAHLADLHVAAQLRGHRLHAVADAEHRHALRPHRSRRARRVAFGDAVGAAREDDALRGERADERVVDVERVDLAVDVSSRSRRAMSCVYCAPKSRMRMREWDDAAIGLPALVWRQKKKAGSRPASTGRGSSALPSRSAHRARAIRACPPT